jgi:hypothetical protein
MEQAPRDQVIIGGRYGQWLPEWQQFRTQWLGDHWSGDPDQWRPLQAHEANSDTRKAEPAP